MINNGITVKKSEGNILESKFISIMFLQLFYFKITDSFIVFLQKRINPIENLMKRFQNLTILQFNLIIATVAD